MQRNRLPRTRQRTSRGVLTVEVALVMPIFVVFLAGLMEFGHFFLVSHMLNQAARQGAHLGSFETVTASQVQTKVKQIVGAAINANKCTVVVKNASVFDTANVNASTINYSSLPDIDLTQAKTGDCFVVQVQVPYSNVSLLPPFWIKNKTITGRAVMRHE